MSGASICSSSWDIDRAAAIRPENVERFVKAMLGENVELEREWYSVYTFQCRRMARFVHGRTIFAGDSAHLVSPFGARGCNGGFADADNLCWKLDLVLKGAADADLVETYNEEAIATAHENILNSTRPADFLTPKSTASQALRDAVLELARAHAFARPFVNSGGSRPPCTTRPAVSRRLTRTNGRTASRRDRQCSTRRIATAGCSTRSATTSS
jgi:3-(3-hydroxy-phenyl)propionate hydroxylase